MSALKSGLGKWVIAILMASKKTPAQLAIGNIPMLGTFANVPLSTPANYPISPDLIVRTDGNTVAPVPSLMDRINAAWEALKAKTQLAVQGVENLHNNLPVYATPALDAAAQQMYVPGHDASSVPLSPDQAANIRNRVNQRFR